MIVRITAILMSITLGMLSQVQGAQTLVDARKSSEEMEIMRGILSTTLAFAAEKSPKPSGRGRISNIRSYYLSGQGAVFEIPTAGLTGSSSNVFLNWNPDMSDQLSSLSQEIALRTQEAQVEAMDAARKAMEISSRRSAFSREPDPSGDAEAAAGKSEPSASARGKMDDARKSMEKLREELEKNKSSLEDTRKNMEAFRHEVDRKMESQEARHQKLLAAVSEARAPLVDALANYADSLTTVKPEEYVNLVLVTDAYGSFPRRVDVISARKSWITDYKAGRLTLDAFRQKVLQYNQ